MKLRFRVRRVDLGLPVHARALRHIVGVPHRNAFLFGYEEPPQSMRLGLFDLSTGATRTLKGVRGELFPSVVDARRDRVHALVTYALHEIALEPFVMTRTLAKGIPKNVRGLAVMRMPDDEATLVVRANQSVWAKVDAESYAVIGRVRAFDTEEPELPDDARFVGADAEGRVVAVTERELVLFDAKAMKIVGRQDAGAEIFGCALAAPRTLVAWTTEDARDALVVEWGDDARRAVAETKPIPDPNAPRKRVVAGRAVRENEVFDGVRLEATAASPLVIEGPDFKRCQFHWCGIESHDGPTEKPRQGVVHATVRGVTLMRCRLSKMHVWDVVFEDCVLDHPKVVSQNVLKGCVYRHVTIRGDAGFLCLEDHYAVDETEREVRVSAPTAEERARRREWDEAYYRDVDWALDVREANTRSMRIENVPPRLVRRDPARLLLVWSKGLTHPVWRSRALAKTGLQHVPSHATYHQLDFAFFTPDEDDVAAVRALREAGIVDDRTGVAP
jgi:hypothetical protein